MTAERWAKPDPANPDQTLAESLYRQFAFHKGSVWIWAGVGVVLGWIVLLNIATTLALMLLDGESSFSDGVTLFCMCVGRYVFGLW